MISETLEPFLDAGMAVLLWAFVTLVWVFTHELVKDSMGYGICTTLKEHAIAGLAMVALCAMTFIVLMWTLSIMGV